MSLSEHESIQPRSATSRRAVVKAAAWAAPVVAVAVAAPFAAASAGQANIAAGVGGNIIANGSAGTASGALSGSIIITNVVGTWATGTITASYALTGVWATGSITKADGTAFVQNETIVYGGVTWTVVFVDSDSSGVWEIHFTAPSQSVSANTTLSLPPAIYSGTFTPGTPSNRNPVSGTVRVAAANVNSGQTVSNSSNYP